MKISVNLEELVEHGTVPQLHPLFVSREDFEKICAAYGLSGVTGLVGVGDVSFAEKPSVIAELDRLLAQREHASISDRFVMSRDVWALFLKEGLNSISDYRGVLINVKDKVEGGVQLKCDYYVKGNL